MNLFRLTIEVQDIPDTFDESNLLTQLEVWLQARGKPYRIEHHRMPVPTPPPPINEVEWEPAP